MKKPIIIFFLMMFVIVMVGCAEKREQSAIEVESLVGYMVIEGNTLYLDEVEIITRDNEERIAELGLTEGDYPSGYCIYHLGKEIVAYELTDETVYSFVDVNLLFVDVVDEANDDRHYSTTERDEFIQHLNTSYYDSPPAQSVPFFIEVHDSKVISVTEEFSFTI